MLGGSNVEEGGRERGDRDEEGRRRSCEAVVLCTASPITADLKIEA